MPGIASKVFGGLLKGLHVIGAGLVFLLMAVIVSDVFGRAFFGRPVTGAPELVRVGLVALLFLGVAQTLRHDRHIRATILKGRVSRRAGAGLDLLANSCGLIVFVLLCYSSWGLAREAWRINEFEGAGALRVPTYPLRTIILLGGFLTVIQLIVNIKKDLGRIMRDREDG